MIQDHTNINILYNKILGFWLFQFGHKKKLKFQVKYTLKTIKTFLVPLSVKMQDKVIPTNGKHILNSTVGYITKFEKKKFRLRACSDLSWRSLNFVSIFCSFCWIFVIYPNHQDLICASFIFYLLYCHLDSPASMLDYGRTTFAYLLVHQQKSFIVHVYRILLPVSYLPHISHLVFVRYQASIADLQPS